MQPPLSTTDQPETIAKDWFVYIIESSDDRLYTGITTDMCRRWREHLHADAINKNKTRNKNETFTKSKGAKFFRGRKPQRLRYLEQQQNRSSASQREAAIKKLTRANKLALINEQATIDWHQELNLIAS